MTKIRAAMTRNRTIGDNGDIPWNIPEDQQHFHSETMGKTVVMGRKTYENIGILNGRKNIILSRTLESVDHPKAVVIESKAEALAEASNSSGDTYIIGGAEVYETFLNVSEKLIISVINRNADGDVKFPNFKADEWEPEYRSMRNDFTIIEYDKV
jgi:dihydrofolate reductase